MPLKFLMYASRTVAIVQVQLRIGALHNVQENWAWNDMTLLSVELGNNDDQPVDVQLQKHVVRTSSAAAQS